MRKPNWIFLMMALIFITELVRQAGAQETAKTVESAAVIIEKAILETGIEAAVQKFRELRTALAGRYDFKENDFQTLGYRLIQRKRFDAAIRVFEMNAQMFPKSANVHISLSEGYLYLGDRAMAEKVLQAALQTNTTDKSFAPWISGALQRIDMKHWQIRSETRDVFRYQPGEQTRLRGPYLGQEPPGEEPRLFAPGLVSVLGINDYCASFSPDRREFYFSRGQTILVCRLEQEGWTAPESAAFSRDFRSHEAHLAFDNQRLFFGGSRPPQPYGIWLTERTTAGWSEPRRMWDGMYATSSKNGNIYFGVESPSPAGIVRTRLVDARYPEPAAQVVAFADSPLKKPSIFHPGIAPDESYIVFDDNLTLYVSFREADGSWAAAVSLGEILGERMATIPSVSPDGKYIFYASHYDLHWVSTKILQKLRP
jgi:hypothetical protein